MLITQLTIHACKSARIAVLEKRHMIGKGPDVSKRAGSAAYPMVLHIGGNTKVIMLYAVFAVRRSTSSFIQSV